jgi:glycosyltransferase involved in cell wall biosynthesis
LDSVLAQTFTDFECILIDDFSKDNSLKICENYAKKDDRIIVLKNDENIGASLTRKKGLDYAKGEYIQFVDSDDYIESDMLEKMYEKASAENLDIVFCDFIVLRESGNLYINADVDNKSKIEIIRHIGVKINSVTANSWNKIIKKQIFDNVIFSNTSYAEDKYTSLQTTYYAEKIGYVNAAFYNYFKNSDSTTENVNYFLKRKKEHFYNYKLVVEFLMGKYGHDINLFEPELSDGINSLKMEIISDDGLNSIINIDELYTNANVHIFRKTWKAKLVSKIVFYLIVHKFPFARNVLSLYIFAKKIGNYIQSYQVLPCNNIKNQN